MDRTACVDLPAFPLQVLLKRHPDWSSWPAAVVERDAPQGRTLWVNEKARACGILPGHTYAAALSLSPDLRAAEVSPDEIDEEKKRIVARLRRASPRVEAARDEPGVFWLDATGLERLQPSQERWAEQIRSDLKVAGFASTVVVGFALFGTYALAKGRPGGIVVLPDETAERRASRKVRLDRLDLDPGSRDLLQRLGIGTVGEFIDLPAGGVERRFNADVLRWHRLATGNLGRPLQPERPVAPARQRRILEPPLADVERVMFVIEEMLVPLLETVRGRSRSVAAVEIAFTFERLGRHREMVRPASPTRDAGRLLELIRLRLSSLAQLPDPVAEIRLEAEEIDPTRAQPSLLAQKTRRDLDAANRALARVRAELGKSSVVRARLTEGHLPEASFLWEELDTLPPPSVQPLPVSRPRPKPDAPLLVRRIFARPISLPHRQRQEPDGWMLRGLDGGPVIRVCGPYIVSGGWWRRTTHREYHYAELQRGELLWVYYDRVRRGWFLHGRVE